MNQSQQMWMSHVTMCQRVWLCACHGMYKEVMTHIHESCRNGWVMAHEYVTTHTHTLTHIHTQSRSTYARVLTRIQIQIKSKILMDLHTVVHTHAQTQTQTQTHRPHTHTHTPTNSHTHRSSTSFSIHAHVKLLVNRNGIYIHVRIWNITYLGHILCEHTRNTFINLWNLRNTYRTICWIPPGSYTGKFVASSWQVRDKLNLSKSWQAEVDKSTHIHTWLLELIIRWGERGVSRSFMSHLVDLSKHWFLIEYNTTKTLPGILANDISDALAILQKTVAGSSLSNLQLRKTSLWIPFVKKRTWQVSIYIYKQPNLTSCRYIHIYIYVYMYVYIYICKQPNLKYIYTYEYYK